VCVAWLLATFLLAGVRAQGGEEPWTRGGRMILQGTDVDQGIQILEQEMSANPMNVNARQLLGLGYLKRDELGFVGMHRNSKGGVPLPTRSQIHPGGAERSDAFVFGAGV